jgi:hypothetical protein
MDTIKISYSFDLENGRSENFELEIDPHALLLLNTPQEGLPDWTRLEFNQCSHCPFSSETTPYCPVAVNLINVIGKFENVVSHNVIQLKVITSERTVTQETTAQQGISSLVGILFATSGCPHTGYLKPMARYHLPLASEGETFYRATGMYLLAQFYLHEAGLESERGLEGLKKIYMNLQLVNNKIVERIRNATQTDSSVNAVVILDMLSKVMPFMLDHGLDEIRHLFDSYLAPPPLQER